MNTEEKAVVASKNEPPETNFLGIDPGREKTGLALVSSTGRLLAVRIVRTRNFSEILPDFLNGKLNAANFWALRSKLQAIVLGDGTNSEEHRQWIEKALPGIPLHIVDERYSTEEARDLYWELFPPKGWRRLIPLGLLTPPEPLDGYAAVVLIRRFLQQEQPEEEY